VKVAQFVSDTVGRYINPDRVREPNTGWWDGKLHPNQELMIPKGIAVKLYQAGQITVVDVSEENGVEDLQRYILKKWGQPDPVLGRSNDGEVTSVKHGDWVEVLTRAQSHDIPKRVAVIIIIIHLLGLAPAGYLTAPDNGR
jgi:hypothetical protein